MDFDPRALLEQLVDREIKALREQAAVAQSMIGADHPNVQKLRDRLAYAERTKELLDTAGYDHRTARQAA